MECALRLALGVGLLSLFLGCSNTSPRTTPPDATSIAASGRIHAPAASSDTTSPPRVTIDRSNADYFVQFPTSISEHGDRVAAIISIDGEGEAYYPEWLVIKDISTNKSAPKIDLISPDLSSKLEFSCRNNLSMCIAEVEASIDVANDMLARHQWRRFPCFLTPGSSRPERTEPGCEYFSELDFEFDDPRLLVSHRGRHILTRAMPAWSPTQNPSCKREIDSYVESVAFDPATGVLVVGLRFVGTEGGGCPAPAWDYHPIRLPMLRGQATHDRDGGAP